MRYRAKKDFILTDPQGEEIFVAQGDKVFIQQHGTIMWKIYSFYSRKLIGTLTNEELSETFGPEEEFKKNPKPGNFKGFTKKINKTWLIALISLLPLGGIAQSAVTWSYRTVKIAPDCFQLLIIANIYKGWWIYGPDIKNCPYSTKVTFEKSEIVHPVGKIAVIEYPNYKWGTTLQESFLPPCESTQYQGLVTFVQVFKIPPNSYAEVRGKITYQAIGWEITEPAATEYFHIKACTWSDTTFPLCRPIAVKTVYPKGPVRKAWWWIRHPFGPAYIKKEIVKP